MQQDLQQLKLDFIGLGAPKAGTTWIAQSLAMRPDICLSEPKEVEYFNTFRTFPSTEKNRNHTQPLEWYIRHFQHCGKDAVKGEFSTMYLADEDAPGRIHAQFPDAKLIICLRNPIDRAYSHYWMYRNYHKTETREFTKAFADEESYRKNGMYYTHIQRYLEYFSRNQLLLILFDDIKERPAEVMKQVVQFLELDESIPLEYVEGKANIARQVKSPGFAKLVGKASRGMIASGLSPVNRFLKKIGLKKILMRLISKPYSYPKMDEATREKVGEAFQQDVDQLATFLNRDLSDWK
ncbi:sulfotransferase domain-containing protein [Patescibacteria group bacterium]